MTADGVRVDGRRRRLVAAVGAVALLAGCGFRESRLNPRNWFGRSREEKGEANAPGSAEAAAQDRLTGLVDQVTLLRIERTPGGAIIRAEGLVPAPGYWNVRLEPVGGAEEPKNGVLAYAFKADPPGTPVAVPASGRRVRLVVVARFVSDQTLAGVRRIQVIAARNRRTAGR